MKLSLLFVLFSIFSSYAQQTQSPLLKAEDYIVEGKNIEASEIYYQESLKYDLWDFDLVNGLLTSLECKDTFRIRYFVNKLFEIGTPIEYFEKDLSKYSYFKTKNWEKIKKNKPFFNRNNKVISFILQLIKEDQKPRINNYSIIDREKVDFDIKFKLDSFIMQNGFPSQKDIGFDYPPKKLMSRGDFNVILIHQIKISPYLWGELLPKLYKDRKISRRKFVFLSAHIKSCGDMQLTCLKLPAENVLLVDGKMYTCCCENAERINENRKRYGLESLESHLKKSLFKMKSEIPFRIGRSFPHLSPGNHEQAIKKLKEVGMLLYIPK